VENCVRKYRVRCPAPGARAQYLGVGCRQATVELPAKPQVKGSLNLAV
jgi:hypothetical protein